MTQIHTEGVATCERYYSGILGVTYSLLAWVRVRQEAPKASHVHQPGWG